MGIPYPLKKTLRFPVAAPPYIERICYATFNFRAGYTADNNVYAKGTVIAAFQEYTPSPFLPAPLRPSLWVVLTVHLVMYMKQGNAIDLAEAWHQSELGRYYQAGKCPPRDVMFKREEEVCETFAQSLRSAVSRSYRLFSATSKLVSLPLAGTAASPKLHGLVGVQPQQQKRAGGIIKHNTNAVKNMAATQAVHGDNVDEGSSPEPPAKTHRFPR
eukprot:jgi/Tetstr1/463663/TSEL_008524.t1